MKKIGNRFNKQALAFRLVILIWLGIFPTPQCLLAQEEDIADEVRIPAVRPATDFYGAVGTGVKIEASAAPTKLAADDWLIFTLKITRLSNAAEVEKPRLSQLDEFTKNFQVDDRQTDPSWTPDAPDLRLFRYRLRPRSIESNPIPPLRFRYFDPKRRVPPGQELPAAYPSAWTSAISLEVKPPRTPEQALPVPLTVPPFAEFSRTNEEHQPTNRWSLWTWVLVLALPAGVSMGWILLWQSIYPDEARLARRMRSRAARKAWSRLTGAGDPIAVAAVVLDYLQERFGLPRSTRTPQEIRSYLTEIPLIEVRLQGTEAFFLECDLLRFAPAPDISQPEFVRKAENLIAQLEGPA